MKLVLIRHGATDWSITGQHTGITNIPLNRLGLQQAHHTAKIAKQLLGKSFKTAIIYTSPLQRAIVTAEIVTGLSQELFRVTSDLLEFNYGDYEGLTPDEIRRSNPNWDIWRDGCPGGEIPEQVGLRVKSFIKIVEKHDELVIAFAHGHLFRILGACAVGLGPQNGEIFTLDPATLSIIEDVRGKRVIKLWNFDPKLVL
jgi:probable phosphoglycerate mutase